MAPYRLISNAYLGSPVTSRVIGVTSSETLYTIGTGNRAFSVSNIGAFTVFFGQSAVLINSGNILASSGFYMFDTIADNFTTYFAVPSGGVTSNVVIVEYAGN